MLNPAHLRLSPAATPVQMYQGDKTSRNLVLIAAIAILAIVFFAGQISAAFFGTTVVAGYGIYRLIDRSNTITDTGSRGKQNISSSARKSILLGYPDQSDAARFQAGRNVITVRSSPRNANHENETNDPVQIPVSLNTPTQPPLQPQFPATPELVAPLVNNDVGQNILALTGLKTPSYQPNRGQIPLDDGIQGESGGFSPALSQPMPQHPDQRDFRQEGVQVEIGSQSENQDQTVAVAVQSSYEGKTSPEARKIEFEPPFNRDRFKCLRCKKKFSSKYNYNAHSRNIGKVCCHTTSSSQNYSQIANESSNITNEKGSSANSKQTAPKVTYGPVSKEGIRRKIESHKLKILAVNGNKPLDVNLRFTGRIDMSSWKISTPIAVKNYN